MLAGLARARMLFGRFDDGARVARQALEAAAAADLPLVEGHARNTLGFSLAMTGAVDEGAAELREAIRIAREHDSLYDLGLGYVNYSDLLHVLGRSDEARAAALEGREAVAGRQPIVTLWLDMRLAELAFDVGEWERSEAFLPAPRRWTGTQSRLGISLRPRRAGRRPWRSRGRGRAAARARGEVRGIERAARHRAARSPRRRAAAAQAASSTRRAPLSRRGSTGSTTAARTRCARRSWPPPA